MVWTVFWRYKIDFKRYYFGKQYTMTVNYWLIITGFMYFVCFFHNYIALLYNLIVTWWLLQTTLVVTYTNLV